MAFKTIKEGWIPFSEFAKKNDIDLNNGNAYKTLNNDKYDEDMKENITPSANRATWIVNEDYANGRFNARR